MVYHSTARVVASDADADIIGDIIIAAPEPVQETYSPMGQQTGISWTDHTFNPWWGCTKVSPACDHCYAERDAARYGWREGGAHCAIWGQDAKRRSLSDDNWKKPLKWDKDAGDAGERRKVFCGSMCDIMEDRRDLDPLRGRLYDLVLATPNLDWLFVSKRPQNYKRFLPKAWLDAPPPNLWLGTTIESPKYYWRAVEIGKLLAVVRFVSMEPMLEPLNEDASMVFDNIDWIIFGGESGRAEDCRPMALEWIIEGIDVAREADVAPFMKQTGLVATFGGKPYKVTGPGKDPEEWPETLRVREFPTPRVYQRMHHPK